MRRFEDSQRSGRHCHTMICRKIGLAPTDGVKPIHIYEVAANKGLRRPLRPCFVS
jgi:hypothetical protein